MKRTQTKNETGLGDDAAELLLLLLLCMGFHRIQAPRRKKREKKRERVSKKHTKWSDKARFAKWKTSLTLALSLYNKTTKSGAMEKLTPPHWMALGGAPRARSHEPGPARLRNCHLLFWFRRRYPDPARRVVSGRYWLLLRDFRAWFGLLGIVDRVGGSRAAREGSFFFFQNFEDHKSWDLLPLVGPYIVHEDNLGSVSNSKSRNSSWVLAFTFHFFHSLLWDENKSALSLW